MKTVLDFTRVPLDKWVDLFNRVENNAVIYSWAFDIKKFASMEVKEQSDYDAEVAEAATAYLDKISVDNYHTLAELVASRKEALPKEAKEDTEVRSTLDVSKLDIPF